MHNNLVIRIRVKAGEDELPMQWAVVNDNDLLVEEITEGDWTVLKQWLKTLQEIKQKTFFDKVILLLPGTLVMVYQKAVNKAQKKHLDQVVPFLVEENLAADIEAFHFVHKLTGSDKVSIVAAPKILLEQLIDVMTEINLEPAHIYAENQLYTGNDSLTLFIDDAYVHVHQEGKPAQTIEIGGFAIMIAHLMDNANTERKQENIETPKKNKVTIFYTNNDEQGKNEVVRILQENHSEFSISYCLLHERENLFGWLCERLIKAKKETQWIDLRSGSFACFKQFKKQWKAWKTVAIVATVWVILEVLFNLTTGIIYSVKASNFQEQSIEMYKKAFPADRSVVDVRTSLQRKLRGFKSSERNDGFFKIMKKVSSVKPKQKEIVTRSIEYNETGGKLTLEITAVNYEVLNNYAQKLRDKGLKVTLTNANQVNKDKIVIAKLVITQ